MANLDNGVVAVDLTALNSANRLLSRGYREVAFVLEGTSTQTVVCEVSMDGTTWYSAPIWDVDQYKTSGVTAAGIYRAVVTGSEYVRIRTSSYSSGTFTCRARLSEVSSLSQSAGGSGGGGNTPPVTPGTTVTETSVTVGTSSTAIIAANSARKALWLFNNGTVDVFLDQGTATTAAGFPLKAGTGIAWTSQDPDVGLAVNGIVATGTADVRVRWVV